jgi:hypothetical protein
VVTDKRQHLGAPEMPLFLVLAHVLRQQRCVLGLILRGPSLFMRPSGGALLVILDPGVQQES